MTSISISDGKTVSLEEHGEDTLVILTSPTAPRSYQRVEAGRIIFNDKGYYQPAPFMDGALSPATLRAIADLIDGVTE